MPAPRLSIFARWPQPGLAKTRLIPAFGAEGAAAIYRKMLEHTVATARASGVDFELRVTGAEAMSFRDWLGADLAVVTQGEGDLGERLARVSAPALVIGSDAPGLTPTILRDAARALDTNRAVLGPAHDGGYYLIGFREPVPFAFADMAWSTPQVCAETVRRFADRDITPHLLPDLADIDEPADLAGWPEFLP